MKRLVLLLAACAGLAACATPTVYAPAAGPTASGFYETKIESDRFRVSYRGGSGAPSAQVDDYALLRAAQVTMGEGYNWFRVVGRTYEGSGGGGPQVSLGTGSTSYGRRSAVGIGVGASFDLGGGPQLAMTLEIKLGKGETPKDRDVYDAAEVIKSISPRLPNPRAAHP